MGLFVSLNENNYFFLQFKGGQNGKDYLVFCSLMWQKMVLFKHFIRQIKLH